MSYLPFRRRLACKLGAPLPLVPVDLRFGFADDDLPATFLLLEDWPRSCPRLESVTASGSDSASTTTISPRLREWLESGTCLARDLVLWTLRRRCSSSSSSLAVSSSSSSSLDSESSCRGASLRPLAAAGAAAELREYPPMSADGEEPCRVAAVAPEMY